MKGFNFLLTSIYLLCAVPSQAQWTQWCPAQTTNGTFVDFTQFNNQVYGTGFFTHLCGQGINYIARWNGNNWEPAGAGLTDAGHALKVIDNELYVAKYQLGVDSNWVFRWNGAAFQKLGPGVWRTNPNPNNSQTSSIYSLIKYNNQIVASGEFNRAAGKNISGIMRWTGATWDSLGSGLSGNIPNSPPVMYPHDLVSFGTDLVVCGNFLKAGGITVNGIARWDGTQWHAMGPGFNSTVYGIGTFNGELYAGGDFTASGTTPLNRIAKWNGTTWVDPGFGFTDGAPDDYIFVHTIRQIGSRLYIAGGLKKISIGGNILDCGGIIAFDGIQPDLLGGGIPGNDVEAVTTIGDTLVAGGGVYGKGYLAFWNLTSATTAADNNRQTTAFFPNPFSSEICLRNTSLSEKRFQLCQATGSVVWEGSIDPTGFVEKNGLNLPSGIYFLHVFGKSGQDDVKKVICQNR